MSCPTCGHTMHFIAQNTRADNFYACPRCGTIKMDAFGQHGDQVHVPKLVERCREFLSGLENYPQQGVMFMAGIKAVWHQLGIEESIRTPEERRLA